MSQKHPQDLRFFGYDIITLLLRLDTIVSHKRLFLSTFEALQIRTSDTTQTFLSGYDRDGK